MEYSSIGGTGVTTTPGLFGNTSNTFGTTGSMFGTSNPTNFNFSSNPSFQTNTFQPNVGLQPIPTANQGVSTDQLVTRFQRLNPIRVKLGLARLGGLPQQTEVIVYRLVQECFNNIAKHSGARQVNISVTSADGLLKLNVEDDGVGFKIQEAFARRDSFGLSGMRERVTLLGGRFHIRSFPTTSVLSVGQITESGALQVPKQDSRRIKKDRGTKISIELPISRSVGHVIPQGRGREGREEFVEVGG